MNVEKYQVKSSDTLKFFDFISVGPNGAIKKAVHYQPTDTPNVYNLAFGDQNAETGDLDDFAISNNGDMDKVLGTVVATLYLFLKNYPDASVYASGSTPSRTRLYRMGITRFYTEATNDFYLFGRIGRKFYEFQIGEEYEGFLVQRKFY